MNQAEITARLPPCIWQFPDPEAVDPMDEGLVAIGADLAPSTLLAAYQQGIFPWFNPGDPIYWWSPEPRCVIYPDQFKPSKSLKQTLKKNQYTLTLDKDFAGVIQACAGTRSYADGTWISDDIVAGYTGLHQVGLAHSIEVWEAADDSDTQRLVGGLYGVQLGRAFFGESMFSQRRDVSKMAFAFLMQLCTASRFPFVDCQLPNNHLLSLGATTLPRAQFLHTLEQVLAEPAPDWQLLQNRHFNSADLLTGSLFSGLID